MITQEQIRKRAHEIWLYWGRPEGVSDEIWLMAEEELEKENRDVKKIVSEYLQRVRKKT